MQLDVQCDSEVDDFQLRKHFSQFGEVISVSTTGAGKSKVTFASSAILLYVFFNYSESRLTNVCFREQINKGERTNETRWGNSSFPA